MRRPWASLGVPAGLDLLGHGPLAQIQPVQRQTRYLPLDYFSIRHRKTAGFAKINFKFHIHGQQIFLGVDWHDFHYFRF